MQQQKMPYLKQFYAHSVWGLYEFSVEFKDGINFISGLNGSNKSTLLNLLYASFPNSQSMPQLGSFATSLALSDDTQRSFACFSVENEVQSQLIKRISAQKKWLNALPGEQFDYEPFSRHFFKQISQTATVEKDLNVFDSQEQAKLYGVQFAMIPEKYKGDDYQFPALRICSPDYYRTTLKEDKAHYHRPFNNLLLATNRRKAATEIDERLIAVVTRFLAYEYGLFEQAVANNISHVDEVFAKRNVWEGLINSFFNETGKQIIRNSAKEIAFSLIGSEVTLDVMELSHGEKSLLYMLLTVFLDHEKIRTFLLDEPETALHLSWQKKFPDALQTLAPKCQFIITTHSPGIVSGRWLQHIQDMSKIKRLQSDDE